MISPPYPTNLQLAKGALQITQSGRRYAIPFQYNPETVTRSLTPQLSDPSEDSRAQGLYFQGVARQTISLRIYLEATPATSQDAARNGVIPQLAALELLLSPATRDVSTEDKALDQGRRAIVQAEAPSIVLVWGQRATPVTITSLGIVEEMFDAQLNPIRASIDLAFNVATSTTAKAGSPDYARYVAYQQKLEQLSRSAYK